MAIILSAKWGDEVKDFDIYKLVSLRDRGGIWKVKREEVGIFRVAELHFREITSANARQINTNVILHLLLANRTVHSLFKNLY